MYRKISLICCALLVLSLTACSREPNQQELQSLYEAQVNETNQLAAKIMQQKGNIIQLKSFEKVDCNKVDKSKDYLCRAKVTVNLPFLGEQQNTAELRVAKAESGWVVVD